MSDKETPATRDLTEGELAFIWRRELVIGFATWLAQSVEFKAKGREAAQIETLEAVEANMAKIMEWCGIDYITIPEISDDDIRKGLSL